MGEGGLEAKRSAGHHLQRGRAWVLRGFKGF